MGSLQRTSLSAGKSLLCAPGLSSLLLASAKSRRGVNDKSYVERLSPKAQLSSRCLHGAVHGQCCGHCRKAVGSWGERETNTEGCTQATSHVGMVLTEFNIFWP